MQRNSINMDNDFQMLAKTFKGLEQVLAALPDAKGDRLWARRNTQFRYIVVVEYNTDPIVKGAGSAIFIHAWRSEGKPTAGCVAMAEEDVRRLIERLDPKLNPHIVILGKQ